MSSRPSLADARKRVLGHLEDEIGGYAIGDLAVLGSLSRSGPTHHGRLCTVPEFMTVFSVLDDMGFLTRPEFSDEQGLDLEQIIVRQVNCNDAQGAEGQSLEALSRRLKQTKENLRYMLET